MKKKKKPRRKQMRLKGYDYSQPGAYFVTSCTKNQKHLFGEVRDGEMIENEYGRIVSQCWHDIPDQYPSIELDTFRVMPNHIHGIFMITAADHQPSVEARSPRPGSGATKRSPCKPTVGNILAFFKYQSTKNINACRITVGKSVWQRNYHDHIIRNEQSLDRIREYIINNPLKWQYDKENRERIGTDPFDLWLTSETKEESRTGKNQGDR